MSLQMTRSEMLALMVGGMATIAGSVFAIYMGMLGGSDEQAKIEFGKFLLWRSVMNAPAALLVAKILLPETQEVSRDLSVSRGSIGRNPIDALANGTSQGLKLALNVGAMLIAFYAVIMLVNEILGGRKHALVRGGQPERLDQRNEWRAVRRVELGNHLRSDVRSHCLVDRGERK